MPEPDHDAGSRSVLDVLLALHAQRWSIAFWPFDRAVRGPYTGNLEDLGISVIDDRYAGSFKNWIREYGGQLDHIMLMRPHVGAGLIAHALQYSSAKLSYYGHDLHYVRLRQEGRLNRDHDLLDEAVRIEAIERQIWRVTDVVLYPSQEEVEEVKRVEPGVEVRVLPPFAFSTFPPPRPPPNEEAMLFVGGFKHAPNADAVSWFAQAVLPRVLPHRPNARLIVVGASPTEALRALAGPNVVVTGQISDAELAAWYERARISLAPLRFGAGVKGKVVEALHAGLPLVTTNVGAQGLPGLNSIVPVHDDAEGQAVAIVRLLTDDRQWLKQSESQLTYAKRHFSSAVFRRALLTALGETEEGTLRE